jgi:hypothetical protein
MRFDIRKLVCSQHVITNSMLKFMFPMVSEHMGQGDDQPWTQANLSRIK